MRSLGNAHLHSSLSPNAPGPRLGIVRLLLACLGALGALLGGCIGGEKEAGNDAEYRMRGDFRKGPYAAHSMVRVLMLNRRGDPSGKNYETSTENDSGDFRLTLPGGAAEFSCTGKYFDELAAAPGNTDVKLTAVAIVPEDGKRLVHVNAFTHISALRIKRLMSQGRKAADAVAQAEKELRKELGIANAEGSAPYAGASLDLLGGNNPHTLYLLTLSGIVAEAAVQKAGGALERGPRKLQEVLDSLAADLEPDGILDDGHKAQVAAAEKALDPALVRKGMEAWAKLHGASAVFPDLSRLVDTDKNGKPNDLDTDDDGDKVADDLDCAPLDSARQMVSADGQRCVAVYPPGSVIALADDRQAKLIWDEVAGGSKYTIYYTQGEFLDSAKALKIDGAASGQLVGSLTNGRPYWFAVGVRYGDRISPLSQPVRIVPVGIASGFTAAPATGKVVFTWTAAEGASAYNLYFHAGAGVDKNDTKVTGVASPYTLTNLNNGIKYAFALASMSGGSESRLGDTISATPVAAPAHVAAASGSGAMVVTWDTSAGAGSYSLIYGKGDTVGVDGIKRENRTSPDTISGLANGTRYAVRVRAHVTGGASDASKDAWTIPMGKPSGLNVQAGTGRIRVDWKPAEGALSYQVYYWTGKNAPLRTTVPAAPATIKGLTDGQAYFLRVAAVNGSVESFEGDTVGALPLAPPDSVGAAIQDGALDLTWAPVVGAAGYTVFYKPGTSADTTDAKIAVKEPKLALGGLGNDIIYSLIVRAENSDGHSDIGNTLHAMPMQAAQNVGATASPDKITVRWDDVAGAAQYNIYYAGGSAVDKTGTKIANVKSPYAVSGLENGQVYSFAVEAIKQSFAGPLSDAKAVAYIASTLPLAKGNVSDTLASYLSLALDATDKPYLAFVDQGKTLADRNLPKVVALENGQWVTKGRPSSISPYTCCDLRIGPGEMPYLAFGDGEQSNKLTVKAYDGSGWSAIGGPAVTDAKAEFMSFAIDGLGIPYVAYNDSAKAGRVSVRRLVGSKWAQVGLPGFSTNASGALSLTFTKSNQPCLSSGGFGAVPPAVMAYDGKLWNAASDVTGMLSRAAPGLAPLVVSPGNLVYIGFPDKAAAFRTTVLASNGSGWSAVGSPGFSDGSAQAVALAVDGRGMPFLAFADDSRGGRISIMKFENGAWVPACLPGFSKGRASYISLAIGKTGTVFAAFQDAGDGGRAQVIRLNGP